MKPGGNNMFRRLSCQAALGLVILSGAVAASVMTTDAWAAGPQTRIVPLSRRSRRICSTCAKRRNWP